MLFVIGSSSELFGLSSSLELWFSVLFCSFGVVLVNFPVGRFTRTIISVSLVHVSAVSVDNPSPPCAPVHVLPLFCGRDGVLGCFRPRKCPFCGRDGVLGCFRPRKCPCFVDGMQKEALLFLLQRLGGVGAHEAEGLCGDRGDDYRQYDCQC